ncbi:MAG TPA: PIN domain-containing protein [Bdellovibrionota bacterium]|nr:PIN domain-containing protein [Bdellovibrionota bacterium]
MAAGNVDLVLADTSIWVDHLKRGNVPGFADLLVHDQILLSAYVELELLCGMRNRNERAFLRRHFQGVRRPEIPALPDDASHFVEDHSLGGSGLSAIDVLLLQETTLNRATLWTRDRALHKAAADLRCLYHVTQP